MIMRKVIKFPFKVIGYVMYILEITVILLGEVIKEHGELLIGSEDNAR